MQLVVGVFSVLFCFSVVRPDLHQVRSLSRLVDLHLHGSFCVTGMGQLLTCNSDS